MVRKYDGFSLVKYFLINMFITKRCKINPEWGKKSKNLYLSISIRLILYCLTTIVY